MSNKPAKKKKKPGPPAGKITAAQEIAIQVTASGAGYKVAAEKSGLEYGYLRNLFGKNTKYPHVRAKYLKLLEELKEELAEDARFTKQAILERDWDLYCKAIEKGQLKSAQSANNHIAKILGYEIQRHEVEDKTERYPELDFTRLSQEEREQYAGLLAKVQPPTA